MIVRQAKLNDIPQMQIVRNSVKENALSNPGLVTYEDYENYLLKRGRGWACEIENRIVAFAIVDIVDKNVWALFVDPAFEARGIGKKLHDSMLDWYFNQTNDTLWLGTAPNTRAEKFYRTKGWREAGVHGKGEIKFEMSKKIWKELNKK
ncbi:MAG: GNAT family N-acetyltransferase [Bacteroidetes bacterium]|nr:MAG: GNAT family N-acetyltransferase [Bacteroidota bacterium]